MSLKLNTLCWLIGNVKPELKGRVACITGPLAIRIPKDHRTPIACYHITVEGKAWLAKPHNLLPFSDPDITRPEFKPIDIEQFV